MKALHSGGVNVAYSSNNIRNAFTPFGTADMLQIGNMLAHVAQFGVPEHQLAVLDMGTHNARARSACTTPMASRSGARLTWSSSIPSRWPMR